MNPLLSAMTRYFRRPQLNRGRIRTGHRKARRPRLCLEVLEDCTVPSASISIAGAILNEIGRPSLSRWRAGNFLDFRAHFAVKRRM
jgi:hypothetical protein